MKAVIRLVFLSFFLSTAAISAQVVDVVRLSYDSTKIGSKQVAMATSANGRYLAFGYKDLTIQILDIDANKFVARLKSPLAGSFNLRLTNDGERLLVLDDYSLIPIDWRIGKEAGRLDFEEPVTRSAFRPLSNTFAVGLNGGKVVVVDVSSMKVRSTIETGLGRISILDISPDGSRLVAGWVNKFRSRPLYLYDVDSQKLLAKSNRNVYTSASFSDAGNELIVAGLHANSPLEKVLITAGSMAEFILLSFVPDPFSSDEESGAAKPLTAGLLIGATVYGLLDAFESYTFILTLDASNMKKIKRISSRRSTGTVTYYSQGVTRDSLALMMTHTQSFDVFNMNRGKMKKKVFTTTENKSSFKASIDHQRDEQARIHRLGPMYLVNTYKNNINQIYDPANNSIVAYFFADSNGEFAVVSRDGRVDGNSTALSKVFWTSKKSSKRTSLESNFETGFTPRLLGSVVNGSEGIMREFDIEVVNERIPSLKLALINGAAPPEVVYSSTQKAVKLVVRADQNATEISEVRLYQNGKLVAAKPASENGEYEFDANLTNSFGEDNYFFVSAQSKSRIESEKERFIVRYDSKSIEPPTLYLVTIGINDYLNPRYNLNYATTDADGMENSVKLNSSSLINNIVSYSIRDGEATKENLIAAIQEISAKAREQDVLWFYYAGHGVLSSHDAAVGTFYLIPHDVTQLYGKENVLKERAISAAELKALSQSIRAQKQVFILDACHSGGVLEVASTRGGAEERAIAQLARSTGSFWITSSGSDQVAVELNALGHGVFTFALLEGLGGEADANKDQKLTVRELTTYTENKVPELSKKYKGVLQFPAAYSFGNDFPIAVFK